MLSSLRKNNSPAGSVGLDVDGGFLAAVQTSGDRVARVVSAELAPGLITDGEVTDVEGLGEALRDFFKDNGLPARVRLGVANQQIAVRYLEPRSRTRRSAPPRCASRPPRRSRCRSRRPCSTTKS